MSTVDGRMDPYSRHIVVATPRAEESGRVYASLSGRAFTLVRDIGEVQRAGEGLGERGAIVLFLGDTELSHRTLWTLCTWAARVDLRLGFYPVDPSAGSDHNRHKVERTWARARAPRLPHSLIALHDTNVPLEELLRRSSEGAECITFVGHGNGSDFRLTSDAALCVLAQGVETQPPRAKQALTSGEPGLPCHGGGRCIREVSNLRRFVGPDCLDARLFVTLACYGIMPHGGLMPPRFSFSSVLFEAGLAASVVGSFGTTYASDVQVAWVEEILRRGLSAGDIANTLNLQLRGAPYVVLGDASVAIEPPFPEPRALPSRSWSRASDDDDPSSKPKGTLEWMSRLLERGVEGYYQWPDAAEPVPPSAPAVCRRALERSAAAWIPWLGQSQPIDLDPNPELVDGDHGCGGRLFRHAYFLRTSERRRRWFWLCDRCGRIADTPDDFGCPWMQVDATGALRVSLRRTDSAPVIRAPSIGVTWEPIGSLTHDSPPLVHEPTLRSTYEIELGAPLPEPGNHWAAFIATWQDDVLLARCTTVIDAS